VIEEFSALTSKSSSPRLGEDMIATTACRHAVKANDVLSMPELHALLLDMFKCEMPCCCPHCRPTLVQISYPELDANLGAARRDRKRGSTTSVGTISSCAHRRTGTTRICIFFISRAEPRRVKTRGCRITAAKKLGLPPALR